jgi:hypothetical protein
MVKIELQVTKSGIRTIQSHSLSNPGSLITYLINKMEATMAILDFTFPGPKPIPDPEPLIPSMEPPLRFPLPRPFPRPLPRPYPELWFRECTPRILVVTDGLNYLPASDFGLTEFVETLRASTIHGMTPIVLTAQYNPNPMAALSFDPVTKHISNFKFKDPTHGLLKSRYDVAFMLSSSSEFGTRLTGEAGALEAVTAFMQAGGGVFATGDHADLGAGMCMEIPRVRNMRNWTTRGANALGQAQTVPSAGGTDRLTTNLPGRGDLPGSNDNYEFDDQSDRFPQRLHVNFDTKAGGTGVAHPLLQVPASNRAIEVFPDHPHEGECFVPDSLTTKLADNVTDEWPRAAGIRVSPEMVALTMSHGNAFTGKAAVIPRSFMAICAYDGQPANVGRVVTDATWHHFVNINIKPGMSALAGRDLSDIKQYYSNLANWLMPRNTRFCRRYPWLLSEMVRYPLFEELMPIPKEKLDGPRLREIGALVENAMRQSYTLAEVRALTQDALEEAIGSEAASKLEVSGGLGVNYARDAGLAALGMLTLATAERFNAIRDKDDINGERAFEDVGKKATTFGVKAFLSHTRKHLGRTGELLDSILN